MQQMILRVRSVSEDLLNTDFLLSPLQAASQWLSDTRWGMALDGFKL